MTKRRILDNGLVAGRVMDLDETLHFVEAHRVLLTYDDRSIVGLFTPGRKMPQPFKRGVHKNKAMLHKLMLEGSTLLCPSPELHRQYWRRSGRLLPQICEKCLQLDQLQAS